MLLVLQLAGLSWAERKLNNGSGNKNGKRFWVKSRVEGGVVGTLAKTENTHDLPKNTDNH